MLVREHMRSVAGHDLPGAAADIPRHPGMVARVIVDDADPVAGAILPRLLRLHQRRPSPFQELIHPVPGNRIEDPAFPGTAARQFPGGHQPLVHQQQFEPVQPVLVIAAGEVMRGLHPLPGRPGHVQVPLSQHSAGQGQAEHALLPVLREMGLLAAVDGTETVHPAEIMGAVHQGASTSAVPIMASRCTRAASSPSERCSVPPGRRGNTR